MVFVFVEVGKVVVVGEVLIGVVVIKDGVVIVVVYNVLCMLYDFIVYVELLVICVVVQVLGNEWFDGCEFWVIFEFCVMCVGVIVYV